MSNKQMRVAQLLDVFIANPTKYFLRRDLVRLCAEQKIASEETIKQYLKDLVEMKLIVKIDSEREIYSVNKSNKKGNPRCKCIKCMKLKDIRTRRFRGHD